MNIHGFANVLENGKIRLAADLSDGFVLLAEDGPGSVDQLIAMAPGQNIVTEWVQKQREKGALRSADSLVFAPCILNPQKIVMVGLNYRRHAAEVKKPPPATPMLFGKFNNSLAAHGETVSLPASVATKFDYEAELVIVIGREAKDVPESSALDFVFGYCVGNDLSARDLQNLTSQYFLGKALDGFAPIGPTVVPKANIANPDALDIRCLVNGELRQNSNTSDMIFGCAALVSYCSRHFRLKPGDLIFTGTPEGVIAGAPPERQKWLTAGDEAIIEIEGLGSLKTVFS